MAEDTGISFVDDPNVAKPVGTAGDFAKTLGAGAAGVGSNAASLSRYFFEQGGSEHGAAISKSLQGIFGQMQEDATGSMNPETQKLAASAMTSPEFWDHPLLATALKATGMLPAVAAIAIPGGLLGEMVGASVIAAGAGGALNAGSVTDEFYKKLDEMDDDELAKQSPKFRVMRDTMGGEAARKKFAKDSLGYAPAINAVLGAATAVLGPAGAVARKMAGGQAVIGAAGKGALKTAGIGAAEGASTNALQEGVADYTGQQAGVDADLQKEIDFSKVGNATLEGGAMGGIMGGLVGAMTGGKVKTAREEAVVEAPAQQATNGRTGTASLPITTTLEVGNPQNALALGGRNGAKKTLSLPERQPVETVAGAAPDAAMTAAIAANDMPAGATATEAAALEQGQPTPAQAPAAPALALGGRNGAKKTLSLPERQPVETVAGAAPDAAEPAPPVSAPNDAPAQAPPPVAEATQRVEAATPPAAPADTGKNVPEALATIEAQIQQLKDGERVAVMFPKGSKPPVALPEGMQKIETKRGQFYYDPKKIHVGKILRMTAQGRENEILNLGSTPKDEVIARVQNGETPAAVTERTPDGTEVRAAAGTDQTVAQQHAELDATKTPGNTVQVENPAGIIEGRKKGTGRLLPDQRSSDQRVTVDAAKNLKEGIKVDEEGSRVIKGRNMGPKAHGNIAAEAANIQKILDKHTPAETENNADIVARAKRIVDEAEAAGLKAIGQIKESTKGDQRSDQPAVQRLRIAKDLMQQAKRIADPSTTKNEKFLEAVQSYRIREAGIIKGGEHAKEAVSERRTEGEAANRRDQGSTEELAATQNDELSKGAEETDVAKSLEDKAPAAAVADTGDGPTVRSKVQSGKGSVRGVDAPTEQRGVINKAGVEEKVEVSSAAGEGTRPKASKESKDELIRKMNEHVAKKNANEAVRGKEEDRYTPQAMMRDAVESVDTDPSEAQVAAGNYAKGHVRVHGLDVTIENPKGSTRRGVGDDGKPWEATVGAHYGYIKGTMGADGDHVDTYIGNGDKHFVIDQVDHKTGAFDEHKVMMNFRNEMEARAAYRRSFSDGKGNERIGTVHELTTRELKNWLRHEDTTKPIADFAFGNYGDVLDPFNGGEAVRALHTTTAARELEGIDTASMGGVHGIISRYVKKQLAKLVGNVPVHYVSGSDLARLIGYERLGQQAPYGVHVDYGNGRSVIYVNDDYRSQPNEIVQTLLHEAAHAAMQREINSNRTVERDIGHMLDAVREWAVYNAGEKWSNIENAFKNEHEFMAEVFSNKDLQEMLTRIPVGDKFSEYLGLAKKPRNMWENVLSYVQKAIEKITGKLPGDQSTMLEAAMKVGGKILRMHEKGYPEHARNGETADAMPRAMARDIVKEATDGVKQLLEDRRMHTADAAPKALKWRGFDNIAQIADNFYSKDNNPVRVVQNTIEKMRVTANQYVEQWSPVVVDAAKLRAKYAGEVFTKFEHLIFNSTTANVDPRVPLTDKGNAHLGKDSMAHVWSKAQHAELAREFASLPKDLQEAFGQQTKHYRDVQNKMALTSVENQVGAMMGKKDPALAGRIFDKTTTDADKVALGAKPDANGDLTGGLLEAIQKVGEFAKIEGPYAPLIRRGDFAVRGKYKVEAPSNGRTISANEFEFNSRKEAEAYAAKSALQATPRSVWVDDVSGNLVVTDPATGLPMKVHKNDPDSVQRFRVTVNNEHLEHHKTERAARRRGAELDESGAFVNKIAVEPKKLDPQGRQAVELSAAMHGLLRTLEKSPAYRDATPTQRAALRRSLEEASLQSRGSTRISSKALPRRNVRGHSYDIVQAAADYNQSAAHSLSKLDHSSALEAGMKEMHVQVDRDASTQGTFARRAIANEVDSRVRGENGFEQGGKFSQITKRLMAVSFIDKLGSPAYSVINGTQVAMVAAPYIAARHGIARTLGAVGRAYADVGAGKIVVQGLKETGRRLKGSTAPDNFIDNVLNSAKLSPDERAALQSWVDTGRVDPSAGMEIASLIQDTSGVGGKIDKGLAYMEGVTREMPRAIEAINRLVTGLAAYRLERGRDGATYESAIKYAGDTIDNTQFNYSPTNSPRVFNHPLAKIALQFKKYGQNMYQLIGTQIGRAIHNYEPGDRAEALKTLAGLAATHAAMAGALGLPTEPFKYLLLGANAAGLATTTWSDVEDKVRAKAAAALGKTGGELLTRGLPRAMGIDLGRMGLDSVSSFGEPKSMKEADVQAWMWQSLAGPVVSLGGDWVKGLNALGNGDVQKAAELMIPLKAAADSVRAYRQATEGKKSGSGIQTMSPSGVGETAARVLGFGSAREAELGASRSAYYRSAQAQKDKTAELTKAWVDATSAGKTKAIAAITSFNKDLPEESRITMRMLTAKLKAREKAATEGVNGVVAGKREKHLQDRMSVYNTGS